MPNSIVLGIIFGFTLFLLFLISLFSLRLGKIVSKEESTFNQLIFKSGRVIIPTAFGIVSFIIAVSLFTDATFEKGNDISNWITLTVEIGIGIALAILIAIYSQFQWQKSEERMSKKYDELKSIVTRIETTGSPHQLAASILTDTSSQEDIFQQESSSHDQSLED